MARSVYDTFVPAGMPFITERKTNWVTTTVTAGQPRPQNLDAQAITITTVLGASAEYIDPSVIYVNVLGYAIPYDMPQTRYKISSTPTTIPVNNAAYIISQNGRVFINDEAEIDVRTLGGKGTFRTGTCAVAAGLNTVTIASAFTAADVGKWIQVTGAATATAYGAILPSDNPEGVAVGTITEFVNASQVKVSFNSVATLATALVYWGWDDTTPAINTVRAAATLRRPAYFPAGNYMTSNSISGIGGFSDIHIKGDGRDTTFWHTTRAGAPTGVTIRMVGATSLTLANVTVPAVAGTDTLTFNTVVGLAVDDWCTIRDEDQPVHDWTSDVGTVTSYRGEIVRIKQINPADAPANSLRFYGAVENDYHGDPTNKSVIKKVTPVNNVTVEDVCFDHTNPVVVAGGAHLVNIRGLGHKYKNLKFRHSTGVSITISGAIYTKVLDCDFEMLGGADTVDPNNSYGVQITGSWGTEISDILGRRCRHLIDMGALEIENQHWSVTNAFSMHCFGAQFNTHTGARGGKFENCHAFSAGWPHEAITTNGPQFGFQIRTEETELVNCSANGCIIGYYIVYTGGVKITNCMADGCLVGVSGLNAPNLEVEGLRLRNMKVGGVQLNKSASLTTMPGVIVRDVRMYGNPTQTSTVDVIQCPTPYGFCFGGHDSGDVFHALFEDDWIIEDLRADDATTKFLGLPATNSLYGFSKPDSVLYENFDNSLVESGALVALTTATLRMVKVVLEKGDLITKIAAIFAGAPTTQTNLWYALYDDARVKLGVTNDLAGAAPTLDVATELTLAVPYRSLRSGVYYVGICQVAAATSTVRGRTSHTSATGLIPITVGNSTAALTNPASAPATAAAITAGAVIPYVYLK